MLGSTPIHETSASPGICSGICITMNTPLLLLLLLSSTPLTFSADFAPKEAVFLSCGDPARQTVDSDGRRWQTDIGSNFSSRAADSVAATADVQAPSVPLVPFMTARIFPSAFTYTFPLSPGRKFLRLYFYPASYDGRPPSAASFSLLSGPLTLLRNFSAAQTASALNYDFIVKEYSLSVPAGRPLRLTFSPSSASASSYAFVNGIEIVPVPDLLFSSDDIPIVGTGNTLSPDNSTAMETAYRLNVGGNVIPPANDTGLLRPWADDLPYITGVAWGITAVANMTIRYSAPTPRSAAPSSLYATARSMGPSPAINLNYNLTWVFSVDSGFVYIVRLHLCEIFDAITAINERVFDVFIFNQTAMRGVDVIAFVQSNGVALYRDFAVIVPARGPPQQDLALALHPDTASKPTFYDAILNGIEVFKINTSGGDLAGVNPVRAVAEPDVSRPSTGGVSSLWRRRKGVGIAAAAVAAGVAAAAAVCAVCRRRRRGKGEEGGEEGQAGWLPLAMYGNSESAGSGKTSGTGSTYASSLPANICRHFSLDEIRAATGGFDEGVVVGVGGFGKVYRGRIDGGAAEVAVKRGNPMSEQGVKEFQTEIEMLSKLRHRHLVSLIGYCEDNREMILVYDYMAKGTLREHLYRTERAALSWRQRLEICIGAARGLHYLHTGAKHTIIHRDVKTTNILVDDKWVAKVSDFGLSKTGPAVDRTHVSTVVKGSFGYLDPEYFRRQQLTEKSDVYSFGVVLFEVLCARPALAPALPKEQVSLAEWALRCHTKGVLPEIVDPALAGSISPECLAKYAATAAKCVSENGTERPSMGDVLWNLEFALQLQESAEREEGFCGVGGDDFAVLGGVGTEADEGRGEAGLTAVSVGSEDSEGLTPSVVFSQIMNPKGR